MWRLNQKSAEAVVAWVVLLSCALPVVVLLPRPVRADSLPASVAACAAEHDPHERLACYDREVARFAPAAAAPAAVAPAAVAPAAVAPAAVASAAAASAAAAPAAAASAAVAPAAVAPAA